MLAISQQSTGPGRWRTCRLYACRSASVIVLFPVLFNAAMVVDLLVKDIVAEHWQMGRKRGGPGLPYSA